MNENKEKLHKMIDSITNDAVAEFLAMFVELWLKKVEEGTM